MRTAHLGTMMIGSGYPVRVQTMYDEPIPHGEKAQTALLKRLNVLKAMGCDIIRFSYPHAEDHDAFSFLCSHSPMPVVADIHFDYKLALDSLSCGARKIRINPGNIGAKWKVEEVVRSAKDHDAAIRIGLNSGSLPREGNADPVVRMVESALEYLSWFDSWGFSNTVVSLKSSNPEECYRAAKLFASRSDCPLHLGVTEAGSVVSSVTRSTWVLGRLLSEGIGSTLRISITGPIETEVQAGVELLRTLGLKKGGIRIVSCPRCGRCSFDSQGFLAQVEPKLLAIDKDLCVAIMGCQVNGPGEASHSDIAITGIGKSVFLYEKGVLKQEVKREDAEGVLLKAIADYE
jgi:(E)-4-hydroxy-3-methylbut-2-enyl-diphosphate synthase